MSLASGATGSSASPDLRPRTSASKEDLRLARPQASASASASGGVTTSPEPSLGLKRSLRLARPGPRTDCATGRDGSGYLFGCQIFCLLFSVMNK
jgi:hypothetical protein